MAPETVRGHAPERRELERHAPDRQPPAGAQGERWAAIDIGTNSVRLLVAEWAGDRVVPLVRDLRLTRLGRGVDRRRRLDPAAVERTLAVVGEFAARARAAGARDVVVAGTSALRDAQDRDEFCRRVLAAHGLPVAVLSGAGEAALSFMGAVRGLAGGPAGGAAGPSELAGPAAAGGEADESGRVWVVDVGGGSTEVVRGTAAGQVTVRASADAGAVRMTELCVQSDPIAPGDWERLADAVRQALAPLWARVAGRGPGHKPGEASPAKTGFDPAAGHMLIGVGGTVTTLAALDQHLDPYDPDKVHGYRLRRAAVAEWLGRMRASTVAERRTWPGLQPQRADIILAGTAIVDAVMAHLGAEELTVSEADLLDGLIVWAARHGRDPAYLVDPARERGI
ncbi:MAG TPA: hypothetical protein VIK93_11435 [Limnochordales bacterium]